jgi:hypothetical protein
MFYIISNSESGINFAGPFDAAGVQKWISERTKDIKPEFHPAFLDHFPTTHSGFFEASFDAAIIVKGEIVVPKAVKVVTEYEL